MGREEVRFASGGDECAAWLFRPQKADGPVPCVVMGSGLSCVRDQGLDAFGERFAAAGFASLAFDYRYFGDSGGEPRSLVTGARQRADFRAALAFARSLDGIDASRLVLWGFSLGGGNVQAVAIGEPGIAAAICVAPVVDGVRSLLHVGGPSHLARLSLAGARDCLRALRRAEPFRIPAAGPPGSLAALNSPGALPGYEAATPPGLDWRNELCARVALAPPYRLARKVGLIRCPILYCIVEQDDVNPPELGKRAARRAPRGELRLYPGNHFDPFLGETFERVAADQIEFLGRHLDGARAL
ncbi:MAG TPA: alpha/beta hydrolase [Solirubrobacterales bacterium]|nr:alpha/beta hydrolase [Solirubrobacterales bacterium]